jgi:hypothetical protein
MGLLFEDILPFIVEISANWNPVKLARFRKFEPFLSQRHKQASEKITPTYFARTNFVVVPTAHHFHRIKHRYSLRPIILFANIDVSRHILVVDTFVFAKSNIGRREYKTSVFPLFSL